MINGNYFLLNVILLSLGTVTIRGLFIAISGGVKISQKVRDLFTYIPAAILPGLFIPATFYARGNVEWLAGKERFVILLLCLCLAYFIRSTLLCIAAGLALLYFITNL